MNNLEIIKEIDREIAVCKEKIDEKNTEETNVILSNIEKLMEQYQPENDIQIRIIKNRHSEVNFMKNAGQSAKTKNRKMRT